MYDRKEEVNKEIDEHLEKIKKLRAELEWEEHELQVCYNVLNLIEEQNLTSK